MTETAYDRAREGSPFSNHTMWEIWSANWCERCRNDGMGIGKDEPQCELIAVAICGRTPLEWLTQTADDQMYGNYHCIMFRDRDDPGGEEPKPVPDPPGQEVLFDRESYTGVRMPAGSEPARETAGAS